MATAGNLNLLICMLKGSGSQQATGVLGRSLQLVPQLTESEVQLVACWGFAKFFQFRRGQKGWKPLLEGFQMWSVPT